MTIEIEPWSVWWVDFDPIEGREQAGRRPAIVVSSRFQLAVTGRVLLSVLPMTTRQRAGWAHHVPVDLPGKPMSYAITEQIRTISRSRIADHRPIFPRLTAKEITEIRGMLRQVIDF